MYLSTFSALFLILCFLLQKTQQESLSPKISAFKSKQSTNLGAKLKLFCFAEEGSKPLWFEWHHDGKIVKNEDDYNDTQSSVIIENSDDSSILILDKLRQNNSGNYSCSVKNRYGSDIQSTILTVKGR